MQGLYIIGPNGRAARPKSKKQVRAAVDINPSLVHIEATSFFGDEYDGNAALMPVDVPIYFVGPDPHTKRNFYGTLTRSAANKWTVK